MKSRQYQNSTPSNSDITPAPTGLFRKQRPFSQEHTETQAGRAFGSTSKGSSATSSAPAPDLQTQMDTAERLGHNFGNMQVFANSQAPIQPKIQMKRLGVGGAIQREAVAEEELQMKPASGVIQREAAEEEELQMKPASGTIQPALAIGRPGDKYEQEADQVAARVMAMPSPVSQQPVQRQTDSEDETVQSKPLANSITPLVQRQTMEEKEEIQTKPGLQRAANGSVQASKDLESQLQGSKGGGSALPDEVRTFMEPRFGADFSKVRVHTDSQAVQMNRELGAQAFAHGNDIYYGEGKSPNNSHLTAHELTHVVQQTGAVQRKEDTQSAEKTGEKKDEKKDAGKSQKKLSLAKFYRRIDMAQSLIDIVFKKALKYTSEAGVNYKQAYEQFKGALDAQKKFDDSIKQMVMAIAMGAMSGTLGGVLSVMTAGIATPLYQIVANFAKDMAMMAVNVGIEVGKTAVNAQLSGAWANIGDDPLNFYMQANGAIAEDSVSLAQFILDAQNAADQLQEDIDAGNIDPTSDEAKIIGDPFEIVKDAAKIGGNPYAQLQKPRSARDYEAEMWQCWLGTNSGSSAYTVVETPRGAEDWRYEVVNNIGKKIQQRIHAVGGGAWIDEYGGPARRQAEEDAAILTQDLRHGDGKSSQIQELKQKYGLP